MSPNSAIKNGIIIAPIIPNFDAFAVWGFGSFSTRVHNPKPMNETEAARVMMYNGTKVVRNWPSTTIMPKFSTVAKKIAKSTSVGLYRVARVIAKNCVLSPISAIKTSKKEAVMAARLSSNKLCHLRFFGACSFLSFALFGGCNGGFSIFLLFRVFIQRLNSSETGQSS